MPADHAEDARATRKERAVSDNALEISRMEDKFQPSASIATAAGVAEIVAIVLRACLSRCMLRAAADKSSSVVSPSAGKLATPMLMPTSTVRPLRTANFVDSTASRIRAPPAEAIMLEAIGMIATN